MVIDAQATPAMAQDVIDRVRAVTDKPIRYVMLSHYHAVRVLGASAYGAQGIVASQATLRSHRRARTRQDWDSECGRFPRLFRDANSIPGLTWPRSHLRERDVGLPRPAGGEARSSSAPATRPATSSPVCRTPRRLFSGDLVEYRSACYCGDAHLRDWPLTLDEIAAISRRARWCQAAAMR